MLEASIRHGARINYRDPRSGRSLLHMAIEASSTPLPYIHALLNAGNQYHISSIIYH